MILSRRLEHIAGLIPKCRCVADIGTDHGYIPIYCIIKGISERAIASDINKGPIESARQNIRKYGLESNIEARIGAGLSTIEEGEADVIVIAGMGGNLISDIILEHQEVSRGAECLILQPVQYPEILRKQLLESNFRIVDEDMVKDEGKLYHILKVEDGYQPPFEKEVYFYTGKKLLEKAHPLIKEYVDQKIRVLGKILNQITKNDQPDRYKEVSDLLIQFEEVQKCL